MKKTLKKGSSVAEMLAVIVILGIIAAIAVPTVGALLKNSRQKAAVEDIRALVSTVSNYASIEGFNGTIEFRGADSPYSKETDVSNVQTENLFYSYIVDDMPTAVSGLSGIIYVTIDDGEVESISFQADSNGIVYTSDDYNFSFTGTSMNDLKAEQID